MTDVIKQKDQIHLLEACKEFTDYGKDLNLFTYPNCGWDLVQQGLVTEDQKIKLLVEQLYGFLIKVMIQQIRRLRLQLI